MTEKLIKYTQLLDQWLKYYGFEELTVNPEAGADKVYKRSRVEAAKFGKVDFYIAVKHIPNASSERVREYSSKMHSLAMRHRIGPPLGFGAMLQVFPLIITENITAEPANFIKSSYCPKHFGAAEFPSVVVLNTGYVYYCTSTPLWGYAYYGGFRRDSYNFFSPKAWEELSKKQSG
ncbi:MAG: hypothetical protein L0Y79_04100 [Chlorobi bacterium]|nr:hypothetical protein [Chlorobiota bacterium]MCI0717180.1 hypothetical protein [Chlorobiota bacterium]